MKIRMFGYIWTIQEVLLTIAVIGLLIAIVVIIIKYKSLKSYREYLGNLIQNKMTNQIKHTTNQHNNEYVEPIQTTTHSYKPTEQYPYHQKYLLTKNEYYFYKRLTEITNPLGLQILTKIRLADLIEVNAGLNQSERGTYFNKIKSKHVDFAIADNMKVLLIIELDDYSHSANKTIERDNFVNNALIKSGYTVVRTKGDTEIVRTALVDKGYSANLYTNTNYYQ